MGMTRLVRHVAYLGDSILRTSFCRNLFTQLHDGDATGDCTYDPGLFEYQFTSKTFHRFKEVSPGAGCHAQRRRFGLSASQHHNRLWLAYKHPYKLRNGHGARRCS